MMMLSLCGVARRGERWPVGDSGSDGSFDRVAGGKQEVLAVMWSDELEARRESAACYRDGE
jgi:hypothetical protein